MGKNFKPYVGLRPFQADESLIFFGREKQTLELLQRLHYHNFVAVVGTSGCGKSSLIRAGLIPALKGGYLVEESDAWCISKMKPGGTPLYNLAESINEQVQILDTESVALSHEDLVKKIEEDGVDAIIDLIKPLRASKHINFFLLIDQFEELFDFAKKEPVSAHKNEAAGLINLMLDLSNQSEIPFYVVMTMRSDFIGDCAEYYRLPEALNESQYLVPRLTRSQLRQVIEGPAKLSQLNFDSALTSKLLNEVGKFQDELPVLQHALLRMWQNEVNNDKDGEIDFKDYDAIGGLNQALSQDANKAFHSLTAKDQEIAENIFKTLTTVDASGRKIRKRTELKELINVCNTTRSDFDRIINVFIENDRSFIIYYADKELRQIVDISHESLIRQWDTLGNWVNEESKNVDFYKELVNARKEYESGSRSLLDTIAIKRIKKNFEEFKPNKAWASKVDDDFNATMGFIKKSRRKSKVMQFGTLALIVLIPSLILFFVGQAKQTDELKVLNEKIDGEVNSLIRNGPPDFLEGYLTINNNSIYKDEFQSTYIKRLLINLMETDSLNTKKNDSIKTNNFIDTETQKVLRGFEEDSLTFFEYARNYVKVLSDSIKGKTTVEMTKEDLAWVRTKDNNTFKDYINFYSNPVFLDIHKKDSAFIKLSNIGKKGWLYAGRKSSNGNQINDERVFNLVYRKGEAFSPREDAMVQQGDVVKLRGGGHRSIYNSQSVDNKIKDALVKNDIKYLISSVVEKGNAVFLEILYEDLIRIETLVKSIDSNVKAERIESVNELIIYFNKNGNAVNETLNLFNDENINDLSAQGRINTIVFLNQTTEDAWSKERLERANKLIIKWEERHKSGQVIIGPQTRERIDELIRHLNSIKIKRI